MFFHVIVKNIILKT